MDRAALRAVQGPLKEQYRLRPESAVVRLQAVGELGSEAVACQVQTGRALAEAGLHPASGGDGTRLCSGDMLLQALVACAGVTLRAVALALDLPVHAGVVRAEGDLDFRGTLGLDAEAEVGFTDIRLEFDLDAELTPSQATRLSELTERYCVVLQTLRTPAALTTTLRHHPAASGPGGTPEE